MTTMVANDKNSIFKEITDSCFVNDYVVYKEKGLMIEPAGGPVTSAGI